MQDFDPTYDRCGSKAAQVIRARQRRMSASLQHQLRLEFGNRIKGLELIQGTLAPV
jgi:hypothetical protein